MITMFILHNQTQKSVPNCDDSFANGEPRQAYGHVNIITAEWFNLSGGGLSRFSWKRGH